MNVGECPSGDRVDPDVRPAPADKQSLRGPRVTQPMLPPAALRVL